VIRRTAVTLLRAIVASKEPAATNKIVFNADLGIVNVSRQLLLKKLATLRVNAGLTMRLTSNLGEKKAPLSALIRVDALTGVIQEEFCTTLRQSKHKLAIKYQNKLL
jgi:hypothetical protein